MANIKNNSPISHYISIVKERSDIIWLVPGSSVIALCPFISSCSASESPDFSQNAFKVLFEMISTTISKIRISSQSGNHEKLVNVNPVLPRISNIR
jgi:hypothetical protein